MISFIEEKPFELLRMRELLQETEAIGRYTNFGPVSRRLERELECIGGLREGRVARMASSGTGALYATVAAFHHHHGRPLRWLVSDYAFHCCFMGPLSQVAEVSPCDGRGLIHMKAVEQRSPASFDGIVVTNPFGLHEGFEKIFEFARRHGKTLLFDNAAGFLALRRFHGDRGLEDVEWAEVVSFHQTKPWGSGEGGAAFLPSHLARAFERAIDFGQTLQAAAHPFSSNYKISDLGCAAILARVERAGEWRAAYRREGERMLRLGREAGLRPLVAGVPPEVAPGNIPLLSSRRVPATELESWEFAALKYYLPHDRSGPTALRIFEQVVNVPSHPGMSALDDETIRSRLSGIA